MKSASELFAKLREQAPGHIASEHGPGRKTRKGENTKSEHGPDAVDEQHAEEGRFKPVVPHNVKSTAGGRTRRTSDSANVKLKEEKVNEMDYGNDDNSPPYYGHGYPKGQKPKGPDVHIKNAQKIKDVKKDALKLLNKSLQQKEEVELQEGKMGQIHADIGEKLDKHIADYKAHGGAEHLGAKTIKTAGHIAKLHGIEQKHAQKFVNDYVDSKLNEGMELAIETKKLSTAEKLNRGLKRGGYDADAAQNKIKEIQKKLADQEKQYKEQGTLKEAEYWKNRGWQKKMADAAKKQNKKKEDLPFTPDEPSKKQAVAGKYGSGYSTARHLARMAARKAAGLKEETLEEGRPSQRHPLEGHPYHSKSHAELIHIAKDAHAAAEAMKSHNTDAENKYRDQASDSATVRHWRKMNGTPEWYKKKYNLKETSDVCPVCGQTPCNCTHITEAWDQPNYDQSIKARQTAADKQSRKAAIVRSVHSKAKTKKKTQKDEKFESDPVLSTQIQNNQ